ncbi:DUF2628 domain-containing protein [Chelativorans sp. AA-79]|uniref:DUF2628 domain-containing protein n=1 Tax=Chelativorans sp. AA-79 TaxID=3028735 RepID=UPI0023F74718|nr:DUF2628 domain-containing protein [Chelativorans sp. AA-79]WEX09595.1 DUF2628 domain-containing protein [Chelativorans sp. AA-79]
MASYVVVEPPDTRPDRAEKAVVVRDGFSLFALIIPLLWFLWHRMWLEAAAFFVAALLLAGLGTLPGFTMLAPLLSLFLYIFIGLEAQALRIASLRRRGWEVWGVVEAGSRDEAEARYVAEAEEMPARQPASGTPEVPVAPRAHPGAPRSASPAFGLIDYPRKN